MAVSISAVKVYTPGTSGASVSAVLATATATAPAGITVSSVAFPDATNTGVPAGTVLVALNGGLNITTAGAIYDSRDIQTPITVRAPDVIIRKSRIHGFSMWAVENFSTNLLVEDCTFVNDRVVGQNNTHNFIGNDNFTCRRCNISGCENGTNIDSPGNVLFEDCYIHDLDTVGPSYVWGNSPHTDGMQLGSGDNITIRHNTIIPCPGGGGTSGIISDTRPTANYNNYSIDGNYIVGTGCSYAVYAPRVTSTGAVHIDNNHMLTGQFGYTACVKPGITVTSFTGNVDAATGVAIAADNGAGGSCTN